METGLDVLAGRHLTSTGKIQGGRFTDKALLIKHCFRYQAGTGAVGGSTQSHSFTWTLRINSREAEKLRDSQLERVRAVVRPGVEIRDITSTDIGQSDNRSVFSSVLFTFNLIMLYHWVNYNYKHTFYRKKGNV